jgi:hypothetical protein
VQVDPAKPKLKPLGTKHLKLKSAEQLSIFAFKFILRRYIKGITSGKMVKDMQAQISMVGRCRLTLSNPCLKRSELSA